MREGTMKKKVRMPKDDSEMNIACVEEEGPAKKKARKSKGKSEIEDASLFQKSKGKSEMEVGSDKEEQTELVDRAKTNHQSPKKIQSTNFLDLRKRLKEESGLQAVRQLLTLNKDSSTDTIKEYIDSGGGPLELLKVLQFSESKKDVNYAYPVFQAVQLVIMKILSDYPHLESSAEEACCYLLHEYTPVVHAMMYPIAPVENKKLALRLLTGVVSLSSRLARDVLSSVSFDYRDVEHLAKQLHPQDRKSIRVAFIHFMLSFMIEGNHHIIRQLLQFKGVLRLLLKEMLFDNSGLVQLVLTTLREKVVSNSSIPKTVKLVAFNTAILIHLLELYSWLGPNGWTQSGKLNERVSVDIAFKGSEEDRETVRSCVHELLILLCTSHKLGVAFHDRTMGTTGQCLNVSIRSLFKSIELVWSDELVKDLVLKIVTANPDLIKSALGVLKPYFEPASSNSWMSTMNMMTKLAENLNTDAKIPDELSPQKYTTVLLSQCAPSVLLQSVCSEKALKNPDPAVRCTCITYLSVGLEKLQALVKSVQHQTSQNVAPVIVKYFNKFMPPLEWISYAWRMGNRSELEGSVLTAPSLLVYQQSVVNLLLLLHKTSPDLLESFDNDTVENMLSSLEGRKSESNEDDQKEVDLLKLKILQLVSILKPLDPTEDMFAISLRMHVQLLESEMVEEARDGLGRLLISTGFMEEVDNEIEIWLHCLKPAVSHGVITEFFLNVIHEAQSNIADHFKVIAETCNEITSSYGKTVSTIDELITMVEEDEDEGEKIKAKCRRMRTQQSISPLVPAMLQCLTSLKAEESHSEDDLNALTDFVNAVLVHVLHNQEYPDRLYQLMQKLDAEKATAAGSYIRAWSGQDDVPKALMLSPWKLPMIELKLSKLFLEREKCSKLLNKIFVHIENAECNPVLLLRSCLFYIAQLHQRGLLTSKQIEYAIEMMTKLTNSTKSPEHLISVMKSVLLHPVIVNAFQPLKKDLDADITPLTVMFLEVANTRIEDRDILCDILLPCKNKLLKDMLKVLKRQKKLTNENIITTLKVLPLTSDDILLMFERVVSLQQSSLSDGWIEVEKFLLNQVAKEHIILPGDMITAIAVQIAEAIAENNKQTAVSLTGSFLNYIKCFPHVLKYINNDLILAILTGPMDVTDDTYCLELAEVLVLQDKVPLQTLLKQETLFDSPWHLYPLLSRVDGKLDSKVISKFLCSQAVNIQEAVFHHPTDFAKHCTSVSSLISKHMDKETKTSLYTTVKSEWEKVPHDNLAIEVVKSAVVGTENDVGFVSDVFEILLQLIKPGEDACGNEWLCQIICETVQNSKSGNWPELQNDKLWDKIVQRALKWGLKGKASSHSIKLMQMLNVLCNAVFKEGSSDKISELFELTISHSDFITVFLGDSSELKYETVSLIFSLVKLNQKVASTSHIPMFLSAYGATLSRTDQVILELLQLYEKSGASVWEWCPCLWGSTAANYYSVRSKSVQPLWRQPRVKEVLSLLEEDIVNNTISRFPRSRSLQALGHFPVDGGETIYDPAFLLPWLTHLLAPGSDVQHRPVITSGAFAIALAALASSSQDTRSAAYLVLVRFSAHLSSDLKEQHVWYNFINVIRAGLAEFNSDLPKLPSLCTTFLARATFTLSAADHPMFGPLHNFFLARPAFSFSSVPAILELIQSKDVQQEEHQAWILRILRDGTREQKDLDMLFQCFAFKLLMSLYSFVYTSKTIKKLILEVLSSCVAVKEKGHVLVSNYGLMPWTSHVLLKADGDERSAMIALMNKLSNYKSCSLHLKFILVSLAEKTVQINDMILLLKTLSSDKIVKHLDNRDIQTLIETTGRLPSVGSVQQAKDMVDYGCQFVPRTDSDQGIVSVLKKLVLAWTSIKAL